MAVVTALWAVSVADALAPGVDRATGLHAVQDAWAHDLRRPHGPMMEHAFGKPDIPDNNPEEWKRAREATKEYIKDFMRARGLKVKCK